MLDRIVLSLFFISSVFAAPAPFLGFGQTESDDTPTPLSNDTIESTLVRPAKFARASYCSAASILAWSCGGPCDALSGVEPIIAAGNDAQIPGFFVAHDPDSQSIVVAHQGTDSHSFISILNDVKFFLEGINKTSFPDAPDGVKVHNGFESTFERTASDVLSAVQKGLADNSDVKKVQVIGHSLGAAIAVMDSIFLKSRLDPGIEMTTTVFGLPRSGNQDWADFVDATLGTSLQHVTNKNDPVPRLPGTFLDFQHPSGEVHIEDDNTTVACPGQENQNCAGGNDITDLDADNHEGPYFDDISMAGKFCPA